MLLSGVVVAAAAAAAAAAAKMYVTCDLFMNVT